MKSRYSIGQLGEVLTPALDQHEVQASSKYSIAGVYGFGRGLFAREPITGEETKYARLNYLHSGALVLSRLKAFEGAIAVIPDEFDGFFLSSEFPTFSIDQNRADANYIKHMCAWPELWEELRRGSKGIGARRERVNVDKLLTTEAPLPDLDEQRRIAAKLDTATDLHINTVSLVPDLDRGQVGGIIASGTDAILQRWKSGSISVRDACDIVNDTVHPGGDPGEANEFIGLEHIAPNLGSCIGSQPVGSEKGRKFRFTSGDVLYGYLRPYLNKVWAADRPGLCSVEQYVLRPNGVVSAELLAHCLRGKGVVDAVRESTNKLQLPRLRSKRLLDLEVPYIAVSEQQYALKELDSFVEKVSRYVRLNAERKNTIKALRSSLLNAAFSGRL